MRDSLLKCNEIFDYFFLGGEMKSAYFSTLNESDCGPTKRNQSKGISTTFIYCLLPSSRHLLLFFFSLKELCKEINIRIYKNSQQYCVFLVAIETYSLELFL